MASSRRRGLKSPLVPDDLPLSFLLNWAKRTPRRPKTKVKKKPKKSTPVRTPRALRGRPAPAARAPRRTRNAYVDLSASASGLAGDSEMELLQPSMSESAEFSSKVDNQLESFFDTFISSDEEDNREERPNHLPRPDLPSPVVLDDSDEESFEVKSPRTEATVDLSEPSTSQATSSNKTTSSSKAEDAKPHLSKSLIEDVMGYIDSVLEGTSDSPKSTTRPNNINLEDYSKETEELLKNATSLLNKFTGEETPEPEAKEKKKDNDDSEKITLNCCPICLESLASRPAAVTMCGHIFCKPCITQTAQTQKKCPTCRKSITVKKIHPIYF